MKLVAIIANGLVSSILAVEDADLIAALQSGGVALPYGSPVQIGWGYDGTNFTPILALAEAQAVQLALMDSSYDAAMSANIAYMGTTFQADPSSQSLIVAVLTACGGALPPGFTWYDVLNVAQPMTFAELQGLAGSILMRGQPLFIQCQTQKAAIRAATDIPTVEAITW